jgi:hypothetical protein
MYAAASSRSVARAYREPTLSDFDRSPVTVGKLFQQSADRGFNRSVVVALNAIEQAGADERRSVRRTKLDVQNPKAAPPAIPQSPHPHRRGTITPAIVHRPTSQPHEPQLSSAGW